MKKPESTQVDKSAKGMKRKRNKTRPSVKSNSKSSSAFRPRPSEVNVTQFRPLFEDMFEGAQYARINPFACIPIVNIRPLTEGGIRRLMALFQRNYSHVDDVCPTGLMFGTDTPTVIELTSELHYLLVEHFKNKGLDEDEVNKQISMHDKWYGIVDGGHSNMAIRRLSSTLAAWSNFKWFVTLLHGGHELSRYRQLARATNSRHTPRFYVELTLFDEIYNLRLEYENLVTEQYIPSHAEVARSYFGVDAIGSTRKFLASMAVRLPERTITELGAIMNKEMYAECLRHDNFDSCGAKDEQQLSRTTDCRIFRRFLTLHSIRMSTAFMNAKTDDEITAQCHALHRAKEHCLLNNLKPVQYKQINACFAMAQLAIAEEQKFLKYLGSTEWPSQMSNVRNNLLRSTIIDSEIESNQGNNHTVLPILRDSLRSFSPALLKECDDRLQQLIEAREPPAQPEPDNNNDLTNEDTDEPPAQPDVDPEGNSSENEEDAERREVEAALNNLRSRGIECLNTDWRKYLSKDWSCDSERADVIITEPPSITGRSFLGYDNQPNHNEVEELSQDDVIEMPNLVKHILKPGGYMILLIQFEAFGEWFASLKRAGFLVMRYPYVLAYRADTIQDRNPTNVPQSAVDYAMVAYLPSISKFNPDFNSVFSEINSKLRRNLALMTDIPAPKSKLCRPGTRSPYYTGEKAVKLLMEKVDLFCPKNGLVCDLYGGTMTTPIASLIKGRRCICFERNTELFNVAIKRLQKCMSSAFTRENGLFHVFSTMQEDYQFNMTSVSQDSHCEDRNPSITAENDDLNIQPENEGISVKEVDREKDSTAETDIQCEAESNGRNGQQMDGITSKGLSSGSSEKQTTTTKDSDLQTLATAAAAQDRTAQKVGFKRVCFNKASMSHN